MSSNGWWTVPIWIGFLIIMFLAFADPGDINSEFEDWRDGYLGDARPI